MRTRVKICGITSADDLERVCELGADAVGFNMFDESPRFVDAGCAASLVSATPPFVTTVGLFVNHSRKEIESVLSEVSFDLLQFHADESDEFCASFELPFMKVIRVGADTDIAAEAAQYPSASALMFDTKVKDAWGGTGKTFDWHMIPELGKPIVLAGGLDAENVSAAIGMVRPYAVDVSSGVEASPGRKDQEKLQAFMAAVDAAAREK